MSTAVSIDLFEIPKIKRTDESASQNVWWRGRTSPDCGAVCNPGTVTKAGVRRRRRWEPNGRWRRRSSGSGLSPKPFDQFHHGGRYEQCGCATRTMVPAPYRHGNRR